MSILWPHRSTRSIVQGPYGWFRRTVAIFGCNFLIKYSWSRICRQIADVGSGRNASCSSSIRLMWHAILVATSWRSLLATISDFNETRRSETIKLFSRFLEFRLETSTSLAATQIFQIYRFVINVHRTSLFHAAADDVYVKNTASRNCGISCAIK